MKALHFEENSYIIGASGVTSGKNLLASAGNVRDMGLIPGSGRSPGGGNGNPLIVFLPGESHEQRSLAGCSSWGHKELDTAEPLSAHTALSSCVQGAGILLMTVCG